MTSAADIKDSSAPLIYGGIAAAASDLPGLLSFEVLGLDVKSVLGFNGRGPVRLAFEQGEVNVDYQFTPVYLTQVVPSVEAGTAVPLWTGGSMSADGVLSERDVVRHLHGGADTMSLRVSELMTSEVVTCGEDDTIANLMELMTERRIRHLPVVADDKLVGIVSIGDVVKARLAELENERKHLEDYITTGR